MQIKVIGCWNNKLKNLITKFMLKSKTMAKRKIRFSIDLVEIYETFKNPINFWEFLALCLYP